MDEHRYDDIIGMEHPTSPKHPRMPVGDRAAQFMPFAALTGYDDAIRETARLTGRRIELGDAAHAELDAKLRVARERLRERPVLTITCFQPDAKKPGGEYVAITGEVRRILESERLIVMADGGAIAMDDVLAVEGELFTGMEF